METLKQAAKAYEPQITKNISDLEQVSVDIEITEETHPKKEGGEFTQNVIEVDGEKYRVPRSVLKSIKLILEKLPDITHIGVIKSGEGKLNTTYQVIPMTKLKGDEEKV